MTGVQTCALPICRYGWLPSLATAIGTAAFFYFGLEKFAQVGLLKGPVEAMLGL